MFRKKWLKDEISSDEGFSVQIRGRDTLLYREGNRRISIGAESLVDGFAVFVSTIGNGPDDHALRLDDSERQRIANNTKRALESQGLRADLS